ncbi:MAG: hypothetical protein AB7F86_05570 [Bdellovibrionales bacterium]
MLSLLSKFLLVVLLLPSLSSAHNTTECQVALSGSLDQIAEERFANWEKNYQDGLGVRGFLGDGIPNTPVTNEIAMRYGLNWWGLAIRIVPTLDEAKANRRHARQYHEKKGTTDTDLITSALYILGSEEELGLKFDPIEEGKPAPKTANQIPVPTDIMRQLIERGGYEIDENGVEKFITPEHLKRRLTPSAMTYNRTAHLPTAGGVNSISQQGWVALKKHGIHDYSKWKDSSRAKALNKLAERLLSQGWTIKFNHNPEAALEYLRTQKRTYSVEVKNADGSVRKERRYHEDTSNRYSRDEVYNTALGRIRAGNGYSIEVYNEVGVLVGGEIGFRHENHFYGDSVFYDETYNRKTHGFDGKELAEIAAVALMDTLLAAGQPYTDPGMITAYTAGMGADLVDFPEFRQKITSGPKEPILLPQVWDPRPADHREQAFADLIRRRGQAFLAMRFISRLPLPDEQNLAVAAAHGLARADLNIRLVGSLEEAQSHAGQNPADIRATLYLVGTFGRVERDGHMAHSVLQEALRQANSAVWFKDARILDRPQILDPKKLSAGLGLDNLANEAQWPGTSDGRHITLPMWHFTK